MLTICLCVDLIQVVDIQDKGDGPVSKLAIRRDSPNRMLKGLHRNMCTVEAQQGIELDLNR